MELRVAIGPSSFSEADPEPRNLLENAGCTIVPNPHCRRLSRPEILAHLQDIDGLIAGLEPLDRGVLLSAPRLKAIARVGAGLENVDLKAAKELGIRVSNTPDAPADAVAELTLTAALSLARCLFFMNHELHEGRWTKAFGRSLHELTALVVGYGRIGRRVGKLLADMGSRVLVTDPHLPPASIETNVKRVELVEGLAEADLVTLHASGSETILSDKELHSVKPGTILLNAARGELVDEEALIAALDSGRISAAWLDTFATEPYTGRLIDYPQVLMTPHAATYTKSCRKSMELSASQNLLRDLGTPR